MIEDDFLAAIIADPDDDAERLVYADWLLQRGDPRGELIHVQCALARGAASPALIERERELLEVHAAAWLGPWHATARRWQFRRGFLDELALAPAAFIAHDEVAAAPSLLRHVAFEWSSLDELERSDDILAAIAALPALAGVERITVAAHHVGEAALHALARLPRLRALTLDDTDTGDAGVAELVAAPGFTALTSLTLASNRLSDDSASALADWPQFAELRELDLSSIDTYHPTCNDVGDLGALAVAAAGVQLARLDLGENAAIHDTAIVAMAGLPQLATLRSLTLAFTAVRDHGALAIAASPALAGLEHLDLGHTAIGDEVLAGLLAMPALRSLSLHGTAVTSAGLERLRARFPGVTLLDDW